MGRDTQCDQRVASIPVSQYGPHACVAGATTLMTECLVLVDQPVAHSSSAFTNIVTGCGSHANAICDQIRLWTLKAIRSWLLVGFQGAQVANKAGKVLGAHLIRI